MKSPARLLLASLAATCLGAGEVRQHDAYLSLAAGRTLKPDAAEKLEAMVAVNPDDVTKRTILLGYYFAQGPFKKGVKEARAKHILWIIQHHPEAAIAGIAEGGLDKHIDAEAYAKGKALWLKQTKARADDAEVLGNAAHYFLIQDHDLAQGLLERAQTLEPRNPKWPDKLGQLHALGGGTGKAGAVKALAAYERAQAVDSSHASRYYRLNNLAKQAFTAGEDAKAAKYAAELLEMASEFTANWNNGNAIHDGNMVLGRVALRRGDAKLAGDCLLRSGATPGSPQLGSFGPNMSLAADLLAKGERDVVLRYFALCGRFWGMGGTKLAEWKKQVEAGRTPDFSGNLAY